MKILIAAALAGLAILVAPVAQADMDAYLDDVAYVTGADYETTEDMKTVAVFGLQTCLGLYQGATVAELTIEGSEASGLTKVQTRQLINTAVENLCPEFRGRLT